MNRTILHKYYENEMEKISNHEMKSNLFMTLLAKYIFPTTCKSCIGCNIIYKKKNIFTKNVLVAT